MISNFVFLRVFHHLQSIGASRKAATVQAPDLRHKAGAGLYRRRFEKPKRANARKPRFRAPTKVENRDTALQIRVAREERGATLSRYFGKTSTQSPRGRKRSHTCFGVFSGFFHNGDPSTRSRGGSLRFGIAAREKRRGSPRRARNLEPTRRHSREHM